ncbi:MAG: hypothetical protein R3F04_12075 [Lysobacteraceae bacterium]
MNRSTTAESGRRKSVMIGESAHAYITALSDQHDLSQADVVEVLLDAVDTEALTAAVERLLGRRRIKRDQLTQKRRLLEEASAHMTAEQIEALITALKSKKSFEPSQG